MAKKASMYWYSQTGNSYLCADWAREHFQTRGWETTIHPMAKTNDIDRTSDLVVLSLHLINFDVPVAVKRFIKRLPKSPTTVKAVALITYHGIEANTPWILRRRLKKRNIDLVSYSLIKAENSEIPMRKIIASKILYNKPDQQSRDELRRYLDTEVLDTLKPIKARFNPFNVFHWVAKSSPSWAPRVMLGRRVAHPERCVNCGMCYTLCPSGALTYDPVKKAVAYRGLTCIGCCGCLNICPHDVWETKWFSPRYFYKSRHAADMYKAFIKG